MSERLAFLVHVLFIDLCSTAGPSTVFVLSFGRGIKVIFPIWFEIRFPQVLRRICSNANYTGLSLSEEHLYELACASYFENGEPAYEVFEEVRDNFNKIFSSFAAQTM